MRERLAEKGLKYVDYASWKAAALKTGA